MTKVTYLKGTQVVSEAEATDNGVVRDGYTVQESFMLMDNRPLQFGPGFIAIANTDSDKLEAARAARLKALGDAWRSPPALDETQINKPTVQAVTDGDVYARRDDRLRNAWRAA